MKPWRLIEAESLRSTRKLVDSFQEQDVLEQLVARSERSAYPGEEGEELHDLLSAPFREPPLAHGSRFGKRTERGVWYGSESARAAFAEVAYYRLVFLEGTTAELSPIMVELSSFRVSVHSDRGIDLTSPPFDAWLEVLTSKTDYAPTQALGSAMRQDEVEVFRYVSARDTGGGTNVGLFSPRAFAAKRPRELQAWICVVMRSGVEVALKDHLSRRELFFPRTQFEVGGVLPAPAA